jgi:hypothetical protein
MEASHDEFLYQALICHISLSIALITRLSRTEKSHTYVRACILKSCNFDHLSRAGHDRFA